MKNIKEFFKNSLKKYVYFSGVLLVFFGIIDCFIKWKILNFIVSFLGIILYRIIVHYQFLIYFLFLLWLLILTILLVKVLRKPKLVDKRNETPANVERGLLVNIKKNIEDFKKEINLKIKQDVIERLNKTTKSLEEIKSEYLHDKKDLLELKMKEYQKNSQVGEFSCALKLLILAIRVNNRYNIEDSLKKILNYLRSKGKSNLSAVWIYELKDKLKEISSDYEVEKKEIEKLLRI